MRIGSTGPDQEELGTLGFLVKETDVRDATDRKGGNKFGET